ncbi:hypothetical protein HDC94_002192 [Leifsonia sp. AK011]|uniref:hypothetical protein n=1 Tax=Leifsonia sp. AK011 TaxID=2723075 RepID=UPI0015CE2962|nr:hypothetical protein [Leifsonia sp. AK011]NYF11036.1 hypothetical protein [Leifsonia sp. AK011]
MTPTSSKNRSSAKNNRPQNTIQARSASARAAREQKARESGEKPPPNVFRRAFVSLVVGLVGLSAVFLLIGSSQGPKVSDAQFDSASIVHLPDQQLRLFLNQPVQDASTARVTVDPSVPATASSNQEVVSVQFDAPLFYDTDYTVRVDDLRGLGERATSSVEHSFTTASPELMYLDRGENVDEIVRTELSGSAREVVYSAPNIISFDVTGQALAVATASDDGASRLQLVSLADGAVEEIRLPEPGVISNLAAADVGSVIAFTFTPLDQVGDTATGSPILAVDLERGRNITAVGDLGEGPLLVTDWLFLPNSPSLIALGVEGGAFMLETTPEAVPLPVGRFVTIRAISQDGTTIVGEDAAGIIVVDIATGEQTRFEPSPVDGTPAYVGEIAIDWKGHIVEKTALQTESGVFTIAMAVDDGSEGRSIYQPPSIGDSIDAFHLSPNGQYVAVELIPDGTAEALDGNPTNPRPTSTTTVIIESATGATSRSFEGFNLVWLPPSSTVSPASEG